MIAKAQTQQRNGILTREIHRIGRRIARRPLHNFVYIPQIDSPRFTWRPCANILTAVHRPAILSVLALASFAVQPLSAQCATVLSDTDHVDTPSLLRIGGLAEDQRRIEQDAGLCSTNGSLIRSTASLAPPLPGATRIRWAFVPVLERATWNSSIPYSLNDGAQWAGRGLTNTLSGGLRAEHGPVSASFAPEIIYEQNRPFTIIPAKTAGRSVYSSPWHGGAESMDLPLRFGDQPITQIDLGDSWIEVREHGLAAGASTDEQWWGPGIRNGIILSNNAAGIPQVYLRTANPIATPLGQIEFRWELGVLTESAFFDTTSTNNIRAFNAVAVTLRTAVDTGLTVGIARAVYSPATGVAALIDHSIDVFSRWNQVSNTTSPSPANPNDQILSAFARWVFPDAGLEAYGEWAKMFAPGLRELLVDPQQHQGYTLGFQWVGRRGSAPSLRIQAEATMLEQTPPALVTVTPIFYTSRFIPQGYTQRGQIIGAAVGPGGSSQWVAGDWLRPRWRAGVFVQRMRVEDEVMYLQPNGGNSRHDVSIASGVRGAYEWRSFEFSGQLSVQRRLNYLFQSDAFNPGDVPTVNAIDVQNTTLTLTISRRLPLPH